MRRQLLLAVAVTAAVEPLMPSGENSLDVDFWAISLSRCRSLC
jgi:hypothetical protein